MLNINPQYLIDDKGKKTGALLSIISRFKEPSYSIILLVRVALAVDVPALDNNNRF